MKINTAYFWLQLFKTRGIGPKKLAAVAKILAAENLNPEMLRLNQVQPPALAKILKDKILAEESEVSEQCDALKRDGINIIYPGHPDFPLQLLDIAPVLFTKGEKKRLRSDSITIVGARDVSDEGIRITRNLAGELAGAGINIVSGYAKGVDIEAHLGALAAGGTTTLVLSGGIKKLRQQSAFRKFNWDRDVLAVSQFDPDTRPHAWYALERNQLICGLSRAVVVIESGPEQDAEGKRSGTFITAKTALDMNLPLFVLNPNCLDDPPKGNADLIALGGYRLDAANGAKKIVERLFTHREPI